MFTVEIDFTGATKAFAVFKMALAKNTQLATLIEADATRKRIVSGAYWKNRTGRLAKSFLVDAKTDVLGASLRSTSKVALFLNAGTKPHPITGSPLRFVVAGSPVFARKVMHPGTKPREFERKETAIAEPRALAGVESAVVNAIVAAHLD